ncbi:ABC-type antimicrobial peptide transport system permease subunit [Methanofollis sp. W23]|nr:ABC-type antimicrobial peptide transport system permease subunit [Methanofollis sp. W23]
MMAKRTVKVKRLGVVSVGLFFAVLMALYALILGIMVFLFGDFGQGAGMLQTIGTGIAGILISVIFFAIGGFIGGAIAALIYNLVFAATGGIEIDLEMMD